jgi:hypothetical protein
MRPPHGPVEAVERVLENAIGLSEMRQLIAAARGKTRRPFSRKLMPGA